MDIDPKHNYWTFDLSPYVFQVKNINFEWVTTWWGLALLCVFFVGAYFLNKKFIKSATKQELNQTILLYIFLTFAILFGLKKMHINWGLRWYSTMYLLGFLTFYMTCVHWIKKRKLALTENSLVTLIAYIIVGMLIGARTAYVGIYNWDYYKNHIWEAVATWQGGLSFHGAVVGILLAVFLFCRKHKLSFFHLTDKMALVAPVGIGFGRIGNFFNGELWGRPIESHVPWAIIFPEGGYVPRHPSQIYQSLGEGWILFLTLLVISRFKRREGQLSAFFIIFYCLYRFMAEYFRAADVQVSYFYLNHMEWAPLNAYPATAWWQIVTMGQILCGVFFIAGLILLIITRKNLVEGSVELEKRYAFDKQCK